MTELLHWFFGTQFTFSIFMLAIGLFAIVGVAAPGCILAERKLSAFIQDRKGPNRVGPWGVFQPIADGIKFVLKENIIPGNVDKPLFLLAPCLAMGVALLGFAVIPWAGVIQMPWMPSGATVTTQAVSIDVGFLYMLAVGSLGVYGVVLAGWASNNKYSFYGGMRATAQMLSYEVPLGLGLLAIALVHGNLRLEVMVDEQAGSGMWNIFLHPIAFLLVLISAFAETNRAPFDLAEAEQELVGGFHTEYSAMKFAMFFLGEYAHMLTNSALMVAMFFGGWHIWGGPGAQDTSILAGLTKFLIFWVKIGGFIGFYMLIRWTLPRFRFDQLMRLAWQSMVPVAVGLIVGQAFLVTYGWQRSFLANMGLNAILILLALLLATRSKSPVTGRQENLPEVEVRPA
ncbi:MAG: NADH-quinone oxidoreductase subunit NuoH [Phycisphaerae bacterium]